MKTYTFKLITLFSIAAIVCFISISVSAQTTAAGGNHSIFVCASVEAKVTGWNPNGQLGNGTTTSEFIPISVNGLSGIVAVASRDEFTLYLLNDGTVWAVGYNGYGQFGNGTTTSSSTIVQIPNLTGVTKIAAGFYHSLFLKSDSTVWACGRNFSGEVGDGTQTQRNTPVLVSSLSGVIDIAAGDNHSMFLLQDSTVWSCGDNQNGSLGLGASPIQIINPTQVTSINGVKSIAGGFRHSLFVKHDVTVWASGYNNEGQLGNGTIVESPIPVQVNSLTGIVSASAGQYHSLFLKNDGTAWGVGYNAMGQLGNGLNVSQNIPTQVNGLEGVIKVSASGYYHSLFLKDDNTFWACGQNNVELLGNGGANDSNVPVQVLDSCSVTTNIVECNKSVEAIIFPNPSNGFFNLEIKENFSAENNIDVYDFLGNLVYSAQLTSSTHILDLSNEAKGIYFYKLSNANKNITFGKIIID